MQAEGLLAFVRELVLLPNVNMEPAVFEAGDILCGYIPKGFRQPFAIFPRSSDMNFPLKRQFGIQ